MKTILEETNRKTIVEVDGIKKDLKYLSYRSGSYYFKASDLIIHPDDFPKIGDAVFLRYLNKKSMSDEAYESGFIMDIDNTLARYEDHPTIKVLIKQPDDTERIDIAEWGKWILKDI